nr:MAG TPA: major capsid protein [Caudoviricetes sp.]
MLLTIDALLNNAAFIKAVIDRALVTMGELDKVFWKDYLVYQKANPDGSFKTYMGTQVGVIAGTVIDRYAGKPVRKRHALNRGFGEVACLGDAYQMDNTRLERLNWLIEEYNTLSIQSSNTDAINAKKDEIVNFLVDDIRQCMLAPMKRLDIMLGELRFNGSTKVNGKENEKGVSVDTVKLPIHTKQAASSDKDNILTWLETEFVDKVRSKGMLFSTAEMNRHTFNTRIASSKEFQSKFTMKFGDMEFNTGGIVTPDMVNRLIESVGMPWRIHVKDEYVQVSENEMVNAVPDDKISFLPIMGDAKLGFMRWKKPYEMADKVNDGRAYQEIEDGKGFISSKRTDEGRFMEYGFEAIPDINIPNKMAIADLSKLG